MLSDHTSFYNFIHFLIFQFFEILSLCCPGPRLCKKDPYDPCLPPIVYVFLFSVSFSVSCRSSPPSCRRAVGWFLWSVSDCARRETETATTTHSGTTVHSTHPHSHTTHSAPHSTLVASLSSVLCVLCWVHHALLPLELAVVMVGATRSDSECSQRQAADGG